MRFLILLALIHVCLGQQAGENFVVEGEEEVTAAPPTVIEGSISSGEGGDGARLTKLKDSLADKPFFCEVSGKCDDADGVEASWRLWQPTMASLNADCQRACRNPCVAVNGRDCKSGINEVVCNYAYVQNGRCFLASTSPDGCTLDGSNALSFIPGTYIQNEDTGEVEEFCAAGVPAPGLPENDFSLALCVVENKQCACDDVYTKFEPSPRTCRALLSTASYAQSAYYDEERRCHLRRCRCMGDAGDNSEMSDVTPSGTEPIVYTLTKLTFTEKAADPVACPGGGEIYVPPEQVYRNEFCEFKNKKCLSDETSDIYRLDDNPRRGFQVNTAQACKNKCVNLFVCASAWTYIHANGKMHCVMQRDEPCPLENLADTPAGEESTYFLRLKLSDVSDDEVDNDLEGVCRAIIEDVPTIRQWKEEFCGFRSSRCDQTVLDTNEEIGLDGIKPCLITCLENQACTGVNLDEQGCHLLSGRCEETDESFQTDVDKSFYFRYREEGDTCIFPEHECEDKYTYTMLKQQSVPAAADIVGICGLGAVEVAGADKTDCDIKCGSEGNSCVYHKIAGCECIEGNIWSEADGACVSPAQCKCQEGERFFPSDSQSGYLSSDCQRRFRCEVSDDVCIVQVAEVGGAVTRPVEEANDRDSLCPVDQQCIQRSGVGYCVCTHGHQFLDNACVPLNAGK